MTGPALQRFALLLGLLALVASVRHWTAAVVVGLAVGALVVGLLGLALSLQPTARDDR
ncbi:MAG: hypothetical protein ABEJ70_08390 [Halobacteriaceae archaeon]